MKHKSQFEHFHKAYVPDDCNNLDRLEYNNLKYLDPEVYRGVLKEVCKHEGRSFERISRNPENQIRLAFSSGFSWFIDATLYHHFMPWIGLKNFVKGKEVACSVHVNAHIIHYFKTLNGVYPFIDPWNVSLPQVKTQNKFKIESLGDHILYNLIQMAVAKKYDAKDLLKITTVLEIMFSWGGINSHYLEILRKPKTHLEAIAQREYIFNNQVCLKHGCKITEGTVFCVNVKQKDFIAKNGNTLFNDLFNLREEKRRDISDETLKKISDDILEFIKKALKIQSDQKKLKLGITPIINQEDFVNLFKKNKKRFLNEILDEKIVDFSRLFPSDRGIFGKPRFEARALYDYLLRKSGTKETDYSFRRFVFHLYDIENKLIALYCSQGQ